MATFPTTEASIVELAGTMETGLLDNVDIYPNPPVMPVDLDILQTAFDTAKNAAVAATAAAEAAVVAKNDALAALVAAMKKDLRYAENEADYEDDKLKLLGWGARKAPVSLAAPGQTQLLEVIQEGEGWVSMKWKAPNSGGAVSAYTVMRRQRPDGAWLEAKTAVTTETLLLDQPRGLELEYRIIAVNKAGEGQPSNTQLMVL